MEAVVGFRFHGIAVAILLLEAAASGAQTGQTAEEIAQAVKQLGDDSFAVREKATKFLGNAGRAAESALQAALKSDDPEVAARARRILDNFKYGIYPDTPAPIVQLARQFQSDDQKGKPATLTKLLAQGSAAYLVALKLVNAEENLQVRAALDLQLRNESQRLGGELMADGKWDNLEELLEKMALHADMGSSVGDLNPTLRNYAAFLLLRGTLANKITQLAKPSSKPLEPRHAEILAYLYRAAGDLPSAERVAEQTKDKSLQKWLLWEQGKWKELLDRHPPEEDLKNGLFVEVLGYRASYLRLSGQMEDFEKELARIRRLDGIRNVNSNEPLNYAKRLFLNDRPQQGIDLLIEAKKYSSAFEMLRAQMRIREALALADKVQGEPHLEAFNLQLQLALALSDMGEKEKALKILAQLGENLKGIPQFQANHQLWVRTEAKMGLKDQAVAHAAELCTRFDKAVPPLWFFQEMYPKQVEAAGVWWKYLRAKFAAEDYQGTLKRLRNIMDAPLEAGELATLVDGAADWVKGNDGLKKEERESGFLVLGETCLAGGLKKQAETFFEDAVAEGATSKALLRLGDFFADNKQWQQASEAYAKAWQVDKQKPLPLFLQGRALVQAGQNQEGEKLMKLAHWLPLGKGETRFELADALVKRGLTQEAQGEWELFARIGALDSLHSDNAQQRLAGQAQAEEKFLDAAARLQFFMMLGLSSNRFFLNNATYLNLPYGVHLARGHGFLQAGKTKEALEEIQACLTLIPGKLDAPISLVPLLEKKGRPGEADDLFEKVYTHWTQICADYPNSAQAHNQAAWLCACCRRRLDEALTHAQRAVALEPKRAGNMDTLAEVHFQRGEQSQAIDLMRACIKLDPGRDYFRKQLQRFEDGDRRAVLPKG
jgi:Tfp pilus assembly protein PilF